MGENTKNEANTFRLTSPDGVMALSVGVNSESSKLWYELSRSGRVLVESSELALIASDNRNLLSVSSSIKFEEAELDEIWEQPWGEQRFVRNNYKEVAAIADSFTVRFRLYDEGVGFRYELSTEGDIEIHQEEAEFNVDTESSGWWIPALRQNHYEHLYRKTTLKAMDVAHTPLTIELAKGGYMAIHEAALYNYGAMNLVPTDKGLRSAITPISDKLAVKVTGPFSTPWRTIIFSETSYGLTTSRIMLNLNDPSKIDDTSWIKPTKFMGIWWGMFISYFTWSSGPKHGATTANAIRYINAAKQLNIKALLIEGWNEGWDGDWTQNGDIMNHMQPYPDFDIATITSYAKSQGVEIIGHHETSGNISHYEWELPEAYDYYKHFGVNYIKTGYVSPRLNTGEFHSSQAGVVHYQKTVEMAAERQIMLDIHEPVKGTGIERTWPNLMTREGVMGQEYEGGAVSPEHATTLPFTRQLAGPMDYTPGLFNLRGTSRKVHSTLSKQLAFYVILYSPMQMAADLPEHYEGHPALKFIQDVPVNWETSLPLDGVIGDYFVVARKDRDRDDWYIGAVTDEESRTIKANLDFLPDYRTFKATIYRDAEDADWNDNPEAYVIEERIVSNDDTLEIYLAPGGGCAIRIAPDNEVQLPYTD